MVTDRKLDERSVLGRAILILESFGVEDRAVGLSELARRTGISGLVEKATRSK